LFRLRVRAKRQQATRSDIAFATRAVKKKPGVYGSRERDRARQKSGTQVMKETNINSQKETKINPEDTSGLAGIQGRLQRGGETPRQPAAETAALQPQEFLSKHELAQRLKRALRTVERWQRQGIIPYVKCGHAVMFNWPDVVAHLEKNFRVCPQRCFGGPVRLPVYQMREERKAKSKCRGLTSAATKRHGTYENQNITQT